MRNVIKNKPKFCVVKLGSSAVTREQGGIHSAAINRIASDIIELKKKGIQVVVVSSGAIHTARGFSNIVGRDIASLQALSSLGQPQVMQAFSKAFKKYGQHCGQILLTHEDFKNKKRYLNARSTIEVLLRSDCIPILNENDSVSFDEITVGDNDHLASMTAQMLNADLVVMLSSSKGLFTGDPSEKKSKLINLVAYDDSLSGLKTASKSSAGRGGMKSKLEAIKKLTPLGIPVIISTYRGQTPLLNSLYKDIGTYFQAKKEHYNKKAWLLSTVKTNASVYIDEGAFNALKKNASLLPVGIKKIEGSFSRGDCISIIHKGKKFAVGVAEYNATEVKKLIGKKASQIESILGYQSARVIIHRNHMVLKG